MMHQKYRTVKLLTLMTETFAGRKTRQNYKLSRLDYRRKFRRHKLSRIEYKKENKFMAPPCLCVVKYFTVI